MKRKLIFNHTLAENCEHRQNLPLRNLFIITILRVIMDPKDLVKKILSLEPKIRIATLFDLNGTVMSTTHRDDVKIIVSYEESLKSLQQAAKSWKLLH